MSSPVFPDLINSSQSSYSARLPLSPLQPRHRTVSLTSVSSAQSRIMLDFVNADAGLYLLAHEAHGSFTPTTSARAALQFLKTARKSAPGPIKQTHRNRPKFVWPDDSDSPLSSGPPSPTISINHTISPSFVYGGLSPSPSLISGYQQSQERMASDQLNPILAKLERNSKLLSQRVPCSTCNKHGSGYPKCGSCKAMWCSRECRLAGGKKHICSQKAVK